MRRIALFFVVSQLALNAELCRTAGPECTERVPLGDGKMFGVVYRSQPLAERNEKITRAMIIVHGQGRNADNYFATGLAAGFLAGALEDTVIVSPRVASNNGAGCKDRLEEGEVNWDCSGWRTGIEATNAKGLYSFDLLDAIVLKLADANTFPNLKRIVVGGHSAGGQMLNRYSAANKIHDRVRVPVEYVVSNPPSYVYLDDQRMPREYSCDEKGHCDERFGPFADRRNCTTYNEWGHGLDKLRGYVADLTADQIRKQLISRPVTYLASELDTLPIAGFDSSCISMAQGPTRFDRAKAYFAHIAGKYRARHKFVPVPLCGHNARCVWTADAALPVLFPKN